MSRDCDYIFVLWADKFEEATASIFVSELREAGLRVKLVGLTPQNIVGTHGLALIPDLTLDQALPLAANAICLIIPHASQSIQRLNNDPRLLEFFSRANANHAKFVIGSMNGADTVNANLFQVSSEDQIIIYPNQEVIVTFARALANSLISN